MIDDEEKRAKQGPMASTHATPGKWLPHMRMHTAQMLESETAELRDRLLTREDQIAAQAATIKALQIEATEREVLASFQGSPKLSFSACRTLVVVYVVLHIVTHLAIDIALQVQLHGAHDDVGVLRHKSAELRGEMDAQAHACNHVCMCAFVHADVRACANAWTRA